MTEYISSFLNTQPFIEADLDNDTYTTFEMVVKEVNTRMGMDEDIFYIANSNAPRIDISVEDGRIYRLSLFDYAKNGEYFKRVSVWMVDKEGLTVSDMMTIDAYSDEVVIAGASKGNPEYDTRITPSDLGSYLNRAIGGLKNDNWELVR